MVTTTSATKYRRKIQNTYNDSNKRETVKPFKTNVEILTEFGLKKV